MGPNPLADAVKASTDAWDACRGGSDEPWEFGALVVRLLSFKARRAEFGDAVLARAEKVAGGGAQWDALPALEKCAGSPLAPHPNGRDAIASCAGLDQAKRVRIDRVELGASAACEGATWGEVRVRALYEVGGAQMKVYVNTVVLEVDGLLSRSTTLGPSTLECVR